LFSWQKFSFLATVALSFLFVKHYPITESNSNSLANALGKLRFLAKLQKSSSNKLAKSLGKNSRLANSSPTGAYMRASLDLANRGFRPVAGSPAREL